MAVPGLSPDLLRQLAQARLTDARVLLEAGQNAGAWYVAGYVLELALKAVICKTLRIREYPENGLNGKLKTHVVEELVLLAGLKQDLATHRADASFERSWKTVTDWKVDDRYSLVRTRQDVSDLLDALGNPEHGVLTWLTNQW